MHKPTAEQQAILQATQQSEVSIMIRAYAGCAKTSTVEMLSPLLPQRPTLALAFNKKIAKELERRLPSHFTVMTMNGLGHRAWGRVIGKQPQLDDKKVGKIVTAELVKAGMKDDRDAWAIVKDLTQRAMMAGMTPQATRVGWVEDTEEEWQRIAEDNWIEGANPARIEVARRTLRENVRQAQEGTISFDDQIYMPIFYGTEGCFPRFAICLVDEAQDLSSMNHEQVRRACPQGRLIVVGDPKQAIYGFRGADSSSMDSLRRLRSEWIDLSLTITFRCPKVIVQRQLSHAPGFNAADSTPEGEAFRLPKAALRKQMSTEGEGQRVIEAGEVGPSVGDLGTAFAEASAPSASWRWTDADRPGQQMAVLCRNNAPLLSAAFRLIRRGVGVQMLGRDIGKGLVSLSEKLCKDGATPIVEFRQRVEEWRQQESSKALANDEQQKVDRVADQAECLLAVIDESGAQDANGVRARLTELFSKENARVTLATGHRSKGLEWPVVLHLDPWRIPSKFAKTNPAAMEQERNLRYIIETRAQRVLIEADLERFEP